MHAGSCIGILVSAVIIWWSIFVGRSTKTIDNKNPEPQPFSIEELDKLSLKELPSFARTINGNDLIIKTITHRGRGYTQGLEFYKKALYESVGLYGKSGLRVHNLKKKTIFRRSEFEDDDFAEGLTFLDDKLYVLTWQSRKGHVYTPTLKHIKEFDISTEGWGLTNDGESLIFSDGTDTISYMSPKTFKISRKFKVKQILDDGSKRPLQGINELEMIDGMIWANVWKSTYIYIISPADGLVRKKILFKNLYKPHDSDAVLNGIAYHSGNQHVYITGKEWPKMFKFPVVHVSQEEISMQNYLIRRYKQSKKNQRT